MTTMPENTNRETEQDAHELELDRRMEALLLEALEKPALPPDFAARLASTRPFAPWEVKQARSWKVPLAVGSTLVAGSAGIALAPLWHLGPGTAAGVWGRILLVTIAQPVNAALATGPLFAEALGKVPAAGVAGLGLATLLAVGGVAYAVRGRVGARS